MTFIKTAHPIGNSLYRVNNCTLLFSKTKCMHLMMVGLDLSTFGPWVNNAEIVNLATVSDLSKKYFKNLIEWHKSK